MIRIRRLICVMLTVFALTGIISCRADETAAIPESRGMDWQENDPWPFVVLNGDRSKHQITISMDDCYEIEWVEKSWELVESYGGHMTFYPLGELLKEEALKPGDREVWQKIAASGSEIGTHSHHHRKMTKLSEDNMLLYSKYPQQVTDELLGYHYPLRTLRPPYGSNNATLQRVLKKAGYYHVIRWDVDSTDPEEVLRKTQNGSILLFHARETDYHCLEAVLPVLAEEGYEMVTVSTLLSLPPLETQTELFNWREFKKSLGY